MKNGLSNMTIETKYNIGDEVWAIVENSVHKMKISVVKAEIGHCIDKSRKTIRYYLLTPSIGEWVDEDKLFPTKEGLLKSL